MRVAGARPPAGLVPSDIPAVTDVAPDRAKMAGSAHIAPAPRRPGPV